MAPQATEVALSTQIFEFEGLQITYDYGGTGSPIIFLHNLGGDRSIWAEQVNALKTTNSVYALDWIGFGDSTLPDAGYTIDTYLRLLSNFIDFHELRHVTLVGNCFGSAMSLLYANQSPNNVHALVLINPLTGATFAPTTAGWAAQLLRRFPLLRGLLLRPIAASLQLPGPIAEMMVRGQLGRGGGELPVGAIAGLRGRWTEPRRLLPLAEILSELPNLAVLDKLEPDALFPPITTIWGLRNRILSTVAGETLNSTLKPRRAIFLPTAGHLPMIEDPESVTEQIRFAANDVGSRL
ncbi:alpha/beta hydrolase [Purpureocillium lavendulum]|uniref:Alpha/beta hydrolase n=1 Tax=Purpureocillium lavendulum TaxID=1247861 RepID=A0AB34G8A4_9HYPO|nr:alpha/beta hydrolase [Purpureocillium lavendulum]